MNDMTILDPSFENGNTKLSTTIDWIDVRYAVPKDGIPVFIITPTNNISVACIRSGMWWTLPLVPSSIRGRRHL